MRQVAIGSAQPSPDTRRQFIAFVFFSGIAAVANVGSRIAFNVWVGYTESILLAFCVGLLVAFVLNRLFVFRHTTNPIHVQAVWFVVVNLAAVVQTLAVSLVLARWLFPILGFRWHVDTTAHVCGVAAPLLTSFIGHKYLTFREH